jgi:hydroxymethylpyrimidine pyrophosphatase-like HAD family hydrolase
LRFLSHKLAVSADEMMAFGDTYNDVEMLKAVKYSYIVANASEDMRQYANFITKSNDDDGVSEIIRKVIKNNGHL